MKDLVFERWHKCSLAGFGLSIYKKGSNIVTSVLVCNYSCVCTSTHKYLHKMQIGLLKIKKVNFSYCFNIDHTTPENLTD